MKYATPTAFRTALDQRLKTESKRTGIALARLRKRIVFELFLRRLVMVAPTKWVLKGGGDAPDKDYLRVRAAGRGGSA